MNNLKPTRLLLSNVYSYENTFKAIILDIILFTGLVILLGSCRPVVRNDRQGIVLAHQKEVFCRIVSGPEDQIAAKSLQDFLFKNFSIEVGIVDPGASDHGVGKCEILLGSAATNPYLNRIASRHHIRIDPEDLTADGYVVQTLRDQEVDFVLVAGGGKRGVFYAVGELKNYLIRQAIDSVVVVPSSVREIPTLKYRWLWTWDWRMEWGGVEPGGAKMGGGGAYRKNPDSFLADYKACIDYMSENGLNGLIIWGFIRDSHGGVTASQELCRYAEERGVRILPGVGTSGYGGYVFEGDHPYNVHTWLEKHPELRTVNKNGSIGEKGVDGLSDHLCPSKKANLKWLDEGAKWLFDNFEIGGVNLEMGDFFVCYCDECKRARAAIKSDEPEYYKDMAISHGRTLRTMHKLAPDAWLSYATYTGFTREMMTKPPKFIEMIPPYAICQWTLTHMLDSAHIPNSMDPASSKGWPEDVKPMTQHSVGYLHWANKSTRTGHDFYSERLRKASRLSYHAGLEGLVLYGELPDSQLNMKLNYLAFREYCFHPNLSRKHFIEKRLAPLYGKGVTERLEEIIELVRTEKQRNSDSIEKALEIAQSTLEEVPVRYRSHWQDLYTFLKSFKQ